MAAASAEGERWRLLNQIIMSKLRLPPRVEELVRAIIPGAPEDGAGATASIYMGQVFSDFYLTLHKDWTDEQIMQWVEDCAKARWILSGVIVLDAWFIPRLTPLSRMAKQEGWTKRQLLTVKKEALAALNRVLDTRVVPADILQQVPKLLDPKLKKRTHDYLRDAWIGRAVLLRVNTGMRVAQAIHEVADQVNVSDDAIKKIWLRLKRRLYLPKGLINKPSRKKGKQTPKCQVG